LKIENSNYFSNLQQRHKHFDKNKEKIDKINKDFEEGTSTFYTEVNDLSAMVGLGIISLKYKSG
jgi:hypothetical protein